MASDADAFLKRPIRVKFAVVSVSMLLMSVSIAVAQRPVTAGEYSPDNQRGIAAAVAPCRDDVRHSILLVSQQPDVLTSLARERDHSQEAFQAAIDPLGQRKQGWFYDLARFPDVLHALATTPRGATREAIDQRTKGLPIDTQLDAWKIYRNHYNLLTQIDDLNQQSNEAFDQLIAPLGPATQQAFRQLLSTPDVLTLLTDQLAQTTELGQAYAANPDAVTQQLDALHDSLTVQNRQELANYQNELANDPNAQQELQQASQAYAKVNGYRTGINPNPAWVNTASYYQNPYSYWFGYPYWYGSPLWYPSAWWSGAGLYYGPGGGLLVYGLPSFGFTSWFLGAGYGRYPHLYNRFSTYYGRAVAEQHYPTAANAGFMTAAHRYLGSRSGYGWSDHGWSGTTSGPRGTWQAAPRQNSRPPTWTSQPNIARSNHFPGFRAGGFPTQTWGGGIRSVSPRSFGGGSFAPHSFGGGGFRGGRR